jgi:hypothetical protein
MTATKLNATHLAGPSVTAVVTRETSHRSAGVPVGRFSAKPSPQTRRSDHVGNRHRPGVRLSRTPRAPRVPLPPCGEGLGVGVTAEVEQKRSLSRGRRPFRSDHRRRPQPGPPPQGGEHVEHRPRHPRLRDGSHVNYLHDTDRFPPARRRTRRSPAGLVQVRAAPASAVGGRRRRAAGHRALDPAIRSLSTLTSARARPSRNWPSGSTSPRATCRGSWTGWWRPGLVERRPIPAIGAPTPCT